MCTERRLLNIVGVDINLVITCIEIQIREDTCAHQDICSNELIKDFVDHWDRETTLESNVVECTVVHTKSL